MSNGDHIEITFWGDPILRHALAGRQIFPRISYNAAISACERGRQWDQAAAGPSGAGEFSDTSLGMPVFLRETQGNMRSWVPFPRGVLGLRYLPLGKLARCLVGLSTLGPCVAGGSRRRMYWVNQAAQLSPNGEACTECAGSLTQNGRTISSVSQAFPKQDYGTSTEPSGRHVFVLVCVCVSAPSQVIHHH